jgi:hypothetical protein
VSPNKEYDILASYNDEPGCLSYEEMDCSSGCYILHVFFSVLLFSLFFLSSLFLSFSLDFFLFFFYSFFLSLLAVVVDVDGWGQTNASSRKVAKRKPYLRAIGKNQRWRSQVYSKSGFPSCSHSSHVARRTLSVSRCSVLRVGGRGGGPRKSCSRLIKRYKCNSPW